MIRLETPRLILRELTEADAPFMFELLTDPAWIQFIGDRGVRTVEAARDYLRAGPIASYAAHGLGLLCVESRETCASLGIAGLIRRESLEDVDLGFAFLPAHRGYGYATECGRALLEHGYRALGLTRIVAITVPENAPSARVLRRLGFQHDQRRPYGSGESVDLYVWMPQSTPTAR
ncbi:MAG: GNAT family N-acetyltransferase [Planctomycetes bacterium]|nr:GNAT family N-acetyltransferase [Planctomycetota bacterium]